MICPYCEMEVGDSAVEAEDGYCPECGTYIMKSSFRDAFDDFDDEEDIDEVDDFEDEEDVDVEDDMDDMTGFGNVDFDEEPPAGYEDDVELDEEEEEEEEEEDEEK